MKPMDIKVSIIIPVYNVAPYLDACLSSCVNQTFRDIEIIVVNDGSPDTSYQIIEKYAAMYERIVVVNKENEGVIYARKSGLDIARGEYIFYLDGDDYIENNAIEILYKETLDKGADYVMAGFYTVFDNNRRVDSKGKKVTGLVGQDLLYFLIENIAWSLCGRLIHKNLFDGVVYQNVCMGEDLYTNMQIALKVKKIAVIDSCLYNYVQHEGSAMAQSFEAVFASNLKMIESLWSLFDIYKYDEQIEKLMSCLFNGFFIVAVSRNKREVKNVLKKYYWDKKRVRGYLRKNQKTLYFLYGGYIYAPLITSFMVKLGLNLKALFRRLRLICFSVFLLVP